MFALLLHHFVISCPFHAPYSNREREKERRDIDIYSAIQNFCVTFLLNLFIFVVVVVKTKTPLKEIFRFAASHSY